jgi:hypothetical protein
VDPFAAILIVGFILFAIVIVLLGVYYPGSGLDQLGLRSARQITETREELEALDLDQMLAAHNKRRTARGERALTAEEMERQVLQDGAEQHRRRERMRQDRERQQADLQEHQRDELQEHQQAELQERQQADAELDQLLAATNARRRRRGLPERSREQAREELGGKAPDRSEPPSPAS